MIYNGFIFKNRKFDFEKMKKFGFLFSSNIYRYKTNILDNTFELIVEILKDDKINTKLIEISTNEEYGLIYVKDTSGKFIGKVKQEFEKVLTEIKDNCTILNIFKTETAKKIIEYIEQKYNNEPEYLWEKFPNNAVFRNNNDLKSKGKWYAAILTAKKQSVGLSGIGEIEIINLKADPIEAEKIIDNKKYFRAYHMNKKHWITILLDNNDIAFDEIKKRIDDSYNIVNKVK